MIGASHPIRQISEVDGNVCDRATLVMPANTFRQSLRRRCVGEHLYDRRTCLRKPD